MLSTYPLSNNIREMGSDGDLIFKCVVVVLDIYYLLTVGMLQKVYKQHFVNRTI